MESFYGGRQGASFVIKAVFKFISDAYTLEDNKKVWVDKYYGQAYDEYLSLKDYEENPSFNQAKVISLPINPKTGRVYSSTDWYNLLQSETMSIILNDHNYKDVWYGEYCLIDPKNKNNRNNGKIYRRTLKGAGDPDIPGGVAEYVGQIVGPAGKTPQLKGFTSVNINENNFQDTPLGLDDEVRFFNQDNVWDESKDTGDSLYVYDLGDDLKLVPGSTKYNVQDETQNQRYFEKKSFIALRGDEEDYFDEDMIKKGAHVFKQIGNEYVEAFEEKKIENVTYYKMERKIPESKSYLQRGGYNWYDVRLNSSTDDISEIHLGFDIPYYVTDMEAGNALPDVSPVELVRQINTVAEPFKDAPFYEKYKINVPRGLRGAWFENIHSVERENDRDNRIYFDIRSITYQKPIYGKTSIPVMDHEHYNSNHYQEDGFTQDKKEQYWVPFNKWGLGAKGWVGTFCWRTHTTGDPQKIENIFLGLDREIKNIEFNNDGTFTVEYTSWIDKDNTAGSGNNIQAVNNGKNGTSNGSTGDGDTKYQSWFKKVDWIKQVAITPTPSFSIGTSNNTLGTDDARVTKGDNLVFTFNNPTVEVVNDEDNDASTFTKNLKTIVGVKTFKDGSLRFYRSDGVSTDDLEEAITWINSISIEDGEDGTTDNLSITFNNHRTVEEDLFYNLRIIKDIFLAPNGVLGIKQSNGDVWSSEQKPISNWDSPNKNLGSILSWITDIYRVTGEETGDKIPHYLIRDNGLFVPVPTHSLLIRFNNEDIVEKYPSERVAINGDENWLDLGVIQELIDGVYFSNEDIIIEHPYNWPGDSNFKQEKRDELNYADKVLTTDPVYANLPKDKAIIATIVTKNGTTEIKREKAIFYYVSSPRYTGWKALKWYEENSSTVIINSTGVESTDSAIIIQDNFTPTTKTLKITWRP